jgi:hypothetical protein
MTTNTNLFDITDAISAYSGRPGCACGCLGNHTQNPSRVKAALTKLMRNPDAVIDMTNGPYPIIYVETDTRLNIVYLAELD